MNIEDIKKIQTWDELLVRLESKFCDIIEHNLQVIEGIKGEAKLARYTINGTIKPGSSYDIEIKEHEEINRAITRILESKK